MQSIEQMQGKQWNRDGYVLLRDCLSDDDRKGLPRWVGELSSWAEVPGRGMKWYEQPELGRQLCRVQDFVPSHEGLANFLRGPSLGHVLELLLGEPATLFKEKINFKLPRGAGFKPHQD